MAREQTEQAMIGSAKLMKKYSVSNTTIQRWCRNGLPHIKVGSVLRFNEAEVEAWLHEQTQQGN